MRKAGRVAVLFAIAALPLVAQTPPREFASGPAKWLFTPEEQKAWKSVRTDDQAIDFIDLFWARRDPTKETPVNENRLEFEARVRYADTNFKEGKLRGALTERGRVLILLGYPANWSVEAQHESRQTGMDAGVLAEGEPSLGHELAGKDTWVYSHEQALNYGVPKLEVVFIHDVGFDRVHRDTQRGDFINALPGAIKSWIANPGLTTVPDWASSRVRRDIVAGTETVTETTLERKKTGTVFVDVTKPLALPAGAGKLTLLATPGALQPQSGGDPFAVASLSTFKRTQDLGWAAEYCAGRILDSVPSVRVQVKLAGGDGSMSSDPADFVPDSIKASPGCYLVRGSIPLADIDPGAYTLTVTIAAGEQRYNLTRELVVE